MGRTGIEYRDVARVANELSMQGRNPTVELIRHKLGTGSFTTIANHLRQWRSIKTNADDQTKLPEELLNIVESLYKAIQEDAKDKIDKAISSKDNIIKELKDELELKSQQEQANSIKINELEGTLSSDREDKGRLSELFKLKQEELQNQQHKHSILEVQLQDKLDQVKDLKDRYQVAQDNLNHYREAVRIQRSEEKIGMDQKQGLYEQNLSILNDQAKQLTDRNKELSDKLKTVEITLNRLTKENTELDQKNALMAQKIQLQNELLSNLKQRENFNVQTKLENLELETANKTLKEESLIE